MYSPDKLPGDRPVAALNAPKAVRVQDLRKQFSPAGSAIFEGITFSIPCGASLAIIGPNGAGKSTLLKCCVRLIEPDGGKVWIHDKQISGLSRAKLRRLRNQIGFVFQKHQLIPELSALTNVLHGALARGTGPRYWFQALAPLELRQRAMHYLSQVGLSDLAIRPCSQLSGGQSQRVAIARALMQEPKILLADEPTASLDPRAASEIMTLLHRLTQESGITLMFVSHHMEHAKEYGDHIIGLKNRSLQLNRPAKSVDLRELKSFFSETPLYAAS